MRLIVLSFDEDREGEGEGERERGANNNNHKIHKLIVVMLEEKCLDALLMNKFTKF